MKRIRTLPLRIKNADAAVPKDPAIPREMLLIEEQLTPQANTQDLLMQTFLY